MTSLVLLGALVTGQCANGTCQLRPQAPVAVAPAPQAYAQPVPYFYGNYGPVVRPQVQPPVYRQAPAVRPFRFFGNAFRGGCSNGRCGR